MYWQRFSKLRFSVLKKFCVNICIMNYAKEIASSISVRVLFTNMSQCRYLSNYFNNLVNVFHVLSAGNKLSE